MNFMSCAPLISLYFLQKSSLWILMCPPLGIVVLRVAGFMGAARIKCELNSKMTGCLPTMTSIPGLKREEHSNFLLGFVLLVQGHVLCRAIVPYRVVTSVFHTATTFYQAANLGAAYAPKCQSLLPAGLILRCEIT